MRKWSWERGQGRRRLTLFIRISRLWHQSGDSWEGDGGHCCHSTSRPHHPVNTQTRTQTQTHTYGTTWIWKSPLKGNQLTFSCCLVLFRCWNYLVIIQTQIYLTMALIRSRTRLAEGSGSPNPTEQCFYYPESSSAAWGRGSIERGGKGAIIFFPLSLILWKKCAQS